jgi:hypothetical protein
MTGLALRPNLSFDPHRRIRAHTGPSKAALPAGSVVYPPECNSRGEYRLWLTAAEAKPARGAAALWGIVSTRRNGRHGADIAQEGTLGRHLPDLIRAKLINRLPVEAAPSMVEKYQ